MEDIIRILPDAVANQIAAGEVVQRPASVVKELMENAIDAGATQIDIQLKEAGRTLIQVIDNGKGMSPSDARAAFLRHATSKLKQADDLFNLKTMGFRGEALASIAAVSQVELVTRRPSDELAWKIEVDGSVITNEEPTLSAQGSRFTVRNLFYNIPARRKFLGDNAKELKGIRDEFIQIALVYPSLSFSLVHNDEVLYQLTPGSTKQRLLTLFGKRSGGQLNKQLYPVEVTTQLITITGFVGDPSAACQRDPLQFFFVNGRYIRHKYFRNAVLKAYETLIPSGMQPLYFLFMEVPPQALDVNIHPTKTEVKFEHEQAIWPIIHATVREALGKFNAIPSIDFDRDDAPQIDVFTSDRSIVPPRINYNPSYNPFNSTQPRTNPDWNSLYDGFHNESGNESSRVSDEDSLLHHSDISSMKLSSTLFSSSFGDEATFDKAAIGGDSTQDTCLLDLDAPKFQVLGSFIALNCRRNLILIHQQRAHIRVLFERYLSQLSQHKAPSQLLMFPVPLDFDKDQMMDFENSKEALITLGFQFETVQDDIHVTAVPMSGESIKPVEWVMELIYADRENELQMLNGRYERLALKMARLSAIQCGRMLTAEEMEDLVIRLLETQNPRMTPDGKIIMVELTVEDLLKRF